MITESDIFKSKILIVDDQEANVTLLKRLLCEAGYASVASTMKPHEVCALHRKSRYDLILLDLQMPGMDGFEVMEGLKANDADPYLPVLVITAQPGHKLRALQAGARDFISKPFDLVEVKTRIRNMLEVRLLYKQLENYNKVLEDRGAGTYRRTARKRSALPQPDRAGVRLVLGAGRDREPSREFRGRSWRCSGSASMPLWVKARMTTWLAGTRRSARCCRQRFQRASLSWISYSVAPTPTVRVSSFKSAGSRCLIDLAGTSATAGSV